MRSELACRASGQKWGGAGAGFELRRGWAWGYFQAPAGKKSWRPGSMGSQASPWAVTANTCCKAPWLPNEIFFLNLWLETARLFKSTEFAGIAVLLLRFSR